MAFVVPFGLGVWLSFTRFTTVTNARFVGLDNYVRIFTTDSDFLHALGFTALFAVPICLFLSSVQDCKMSFLCCPELMRRDFCAIIP